MTEQVNNAGSGASFTANTKAPKDNTVIEEGTGTITSDSLAAESLQSGGSFADGKATADSVPSKSTTANTTDTSAARTLAPAANASSRGEDSGSSGSTSGNSGSSGSASSADFGAGLGSSASGGGLGSSAGGSTSTGAQSGGSSGAGGSSTSSGNTQSSSTPSGQENFKPKGENITEGGFDSNAPNASFNNDIGGENDPGRVAESKMAKGNATAGANSGFDGANQPDDIHQGGFENLKEESA